MVVPFLGVAAEGADHPYQEVAVVEAVHLLVAEEAAVVVAVRQTSVAMAAAEVYLLRPY